jgi:hypothetical protein
MHPVPEHTFAPLDPAASTNRGAKCLLFVALALVVFEGAIRKWLIGSETGFWSYLSYFSKDLVFAAILLWPAQRIQSSAITVFTSWAVPGALLFLAGAMLSALRSLNPIGALLTLRAGLILPVLALLAARRLPGIRPAHLALVIVCCTLTNCGLGIAQSRLPPEHPLNRYVLADSPVCAVETAVRATGTFSYITGLGIMSSVGIWGGMVLLAFAQTRRAQCIAVTGIVAGFGCGLTSVSRGPILLGCLMLLAWGCLSRSGFGALSKSTATWVPGLLLICCVGVFPHFSQLGRAVIERHQTGDDTVSQRAFGQLQEGGEVAALVPFGAGLGTEQVAGNYAATGTMSFNNYETQLPRLIAETGLLGLAGYLAICLGAILGLQEARRSARTDAMNAALFATQLLFIPLFYSNVLFNHVASAFVWMLFSAVLHQL